jgi:hypothetical protein
MLWVRLAMIFASLRLMAAEHPLRLLRKLAKFPKQYTNVKALKGTIAEKRETMVNVEERAVERAVTFRRFKKSKLTPLRFFSLAGFPEDRGKELAKYFTGLPDLLASDAQELYRVHGITASEVQKILRFSDKLKFTQNLSPHAASSTPTPRWTPALDAQLLAATETFDASFGDPWLYVAAELSLSPDACLHRYAELKIRPRWNQSQAELFLGKCLSSVLHMNRDFRLVPPRLVVVPTEQTLPPCDPIRDEWRPKEHVWGVFMK